MIGCNKFLWIHVMKTGGHWVRHRLLPALPPEWEPTDIYRHVELKEARELYPNVPSWGCVRNPWSWYVSIHCWMFQHWWEKTGTFCQPASERTERARRWGELFDAGKRFDDILPIMLEGELLESYSGHVTRMLSDGEQWVDHIVRYENLRPEVEQLLTKLCGTLPPELLNGIRAGAPSNTSRHGPPRAYYNARTLQMVAEADRELIQRFGYQPPG